MAVEKATQVKTQYMCSELIQVQQLDGGSVQTSTAILEEIAPASACIQTETPMSEGTVLRLVCPNWARSNEFQGRVVECWHQERLGYFVHVEFEPGNEWCAAKYSPAHLLDTASLIPKRVPEKTNTKTGSREKRSLPEMVNA
jgi:hypothetical protein